VPKKNVSLVHVADMFDGVGEAHVHEKPSPDLHSEKHEMKNTKEPDV
jgi:hypothetical protein